MKLHKRMPDDLIEVLMLLLFCSIISFCQIIRLNYSDPALICFPHFPPEINNTVALPFCVIHIGLVLLLSVVNTSQVRHG